MTALESWTLSFLLNSLWQIPLLLFVGQLAARALTRLGPNIEHRIWVTILVLQTCVPACSAVPLNSVPALWPWADQTHRTGAPHVSVDVGPGIALSTLHIPQGLLSALALACAAVTLYFTARFAWRAVVLYSLSRNSAPLQLTGDNAQAWDECRAHFAIGSVTLAASPSIFAPITLGLRRRFILLPASMLPALSQQDLRTVVAHEFAHIRRGDFVKNLFYELLSVLVSYHPAVWVTRHRIMESREMICDQMAARLAPNSLEYARSLLRLAGLLVHGIPVRVPHAIGIFDANTLERRIMSLKQNRSEIVGLRRIAAIAGCAALLASTCATALSLHVHVDAAAAASDGMPEKSATPLTVPAKQVQDHKIGGPTPVYPVDAKKARIQGKVVLTAIIGKDGTVERLEVVSGPKELQQSALDAVRQWTYKPFLLNGDPTVIKTTINVTYTLAR